MREDESVAGLAGDAALFERFYRDHIDAVGGFVARRVNNPHTAAELTADVFVAVIASSSSYRSERGSPRGWLFGIARNVISDHHARRQREGDARRRAAGRRELLPDAIGRIEERIDAERHHRRLYRLIESLPEQDWRLFELVALDGLSVADAARVLGIKPVTARVRLHRSRSRLQGLAENPTPPTDDRETTCAPTRIR